MGFKNVNFDKIIHFFNANIVETTKTGLMPT